MMNKSIVTKKYFMIMLLLSFLFVFSSCDKGKWQGEGKFVFFDDGSADVKFYLYPIDKNAKNNVDKARDFLKKEFPGARVVVFQKKKDKYIILRRKMSSKNNIYLKKVDGSWQFNYINQFYDNVEIRKMTVVMPGWITKSNSAGKLGNYAWWDNLHVGPSYTATSTGLPFIYVLGLIILLIVLVLGGGAVWFLLRKDREEKKDTDEEDEPKPGSGEDGVFKY